ncbi:MAG: putative DNA binding domain-containing protein [Clostridiales bacterium]|nr:putative DNA binding domain-containing protein [Clostridiales bacterium]
MEFADIESLVKQVIEKKHESQVIEIKAAKKGCPEKLYDTLSSFSNQDDGGIIIFGIDEAGGYALTGVYDVQDIQIRINNQCKEMEPPVRPLISSATIDGRDIVVAEIPGIEITSRPCYHKGRGIIKSSYVRCGESDEPMTDYEIYSYEAYRKKYLDDIRPVDRADINSMDIEKLNKYRVLCKENKPNLSKIDDEQLNELMSITRNGTFTLTAVLLFGLYPQAYFPQLSIIATAVYGNEMGSLVDNGARFADSRRIEGTVEDMLNGAIQFVKNNMRVSTSIDSNSGKREDKIEYPITAVREVILNAIVHRDYSIHTEGMPIQLTMYSDRLEVKNPGGLYGRISVSQLGKMQSDTRNPVLATAMETLKLTENRYSGIPTIRSEMQKAGLCSPEFINARGEFTVVLFNYPYKAKNSDDITNDILDFCLTPRTRIEIAEFLGVTTPTYAIKRYIKPLIESGKVGITIPEKPNSSNQKYYTIANVLKK